MIQCAQGLSLSLANAAVPEWSVGRSDVGRPGRGRAVLRSRPAVLPGWEEKEGQRRHRSDSIEALGFCQIGVFTDGVPTRRPLKPPDFV